jgi:hypothetical protein
VIHLLRVTAFNLPRLTRFSTIVLALGLCAIEAWEFTHSAAPAYLAALFLVAAVAALVAAGSMAAGLRKAAWTSTVGLAVLSLVGYIVSRTVGLPGFESDLGQWHSELGTLSMFLEVGLVAIYASVALGWNIDVVGARDWDTYFSR